MTFAHINSSLILMFTDNTSPMFPALPIGKFSPNFSLFAKLQTETWISGTLFGYNDHEVFVLVDQFGLFLRDNE